MKKRTVKDNIYNYIELDNFFWQFIDTPEYQRMRDIKQLGTIFYVFPGAIHNRFSHSLGVGHLCQQVMTHFQDSRNFKHENGYTICDQDVNNVVLAGLMHDLGHGVYSHLFDRQVVPKLFQRKGLKCNWEHEDASAMMLDYLVD